MDAIIAKEMNTKESPRMLNIHPVFAATRIFWYSIYDLDERSFKIKFYLGEGASKENYIILIYSEYVEFQLN